MPEERAKHSQIRQDAKSMQRGEVLTNNNINTNHPGQRTKNNVEVPLPECKNTDLVLEGLSPGLGDRTSTGRHERRQGPRACHIRVQTNRQCPPVRTRPREDVFFTDFLCFAEDQQKAARSSAGRNERPAEPSAPLVDREMTRNTAMRSRKSISESTFGCGSDFYRAMHERT